MRLAMIIPALFLTACGGASLPGLQEAIAENPVEAMRNNPVVAIPTAGVPPLVSTADDASFAAILNGVRLNAGVGALSYDGRLDLAAQSYADELLAQGRFSHTGADGSTVATRATAAGYNWTAIGENLGRGQQTQQDIVTAWQNSTDGHKENNENPSFDDFGIGVAGDGSNRRWVLVLGAD